MPYTHKSTIYYNTFQYKNQHFSHIINNFALFSLFFVVFLEKGARVCYNIKNERIGGRYVGISVQKKHTG